METSENFAEWKEAVQANLNQLQAVAPYLNDSGKERKEVMTTLVNLACFCNTAGELLQWIECREDMDRQDIQRLSSYHAQSPIRCLRRIVEAADKT